MKKRKLLKSGKTVSEVGLGCMSFAGFYGPTTEKEAHETLAKAMDLGIDFLDTANVYGNGRSEEVIGFLSPGRCQQVFDSHEGIDLAESGDRSARVQQ